MATNDAIGFVEIESTLSIGQAMNGTSLIALSKVLKRRDILKALSFFINRFNDNFNAKGKLDDMQIATLSGDLFEVFQYETLEDAMLMFKFARQGKIGDGKDFKLDSQTVFHKWVPAYLELKSIERENQHSKSKGELNSLSNFKWEKEAIEKFNVDAKHRNPSKLGQRIKEKISVDEQPVIILKDRSQFLNDMFLNIKRMTDDQLKNYLVKSDVKRSNGKDSIPFDPDIYAMVEKEIDSRL